MRLVEKGLTEASHVCTIYLGQRVKDTLGRCTHPVPRSRLTQFFGYHLATRLLFATFGDSDVG
jgi:hypothetical protein